MENEKAKFKNDSDKIGSGSQKVSNGVQFPANSVLDWYAEAESMLARFLEYVPYCDAHKEVWSAKLVPILQETCSQLDSLWRWEAVNVHGRKNDNNINIRDYFELYGSKITPHWVVFGQISRRLSPLLTYGGKWLISLNRNIPKELQTGGQRDTRKSNMTV